MILWSILAVLLILLVITIISAKGIWNFLLNFAPSQKKIEADVTKIRALLAAQQQQLAPWKREELDLLSFEQTNFRTRKSKTEVAQGVYNSIYHEPLFTYAYKRYISKNYGANAIILALTSEKEFLYRIHKQQVTIYINNKLFGTVKPNYELYTPKQRLLARMIVDKGAGLFPVLVYQAKGKLRELGNIVNSKKSEQITPRALQLVEPTMNNTEEDIFRSLVIYEVIRQGVKRDE